MKNLILIFTLFFSLSAFGAEPKFSPTGLEGWGKNGVRIEIGDYSDRDKNFPLKEIKTKVELRLLQAGIKGDNKPTGQYIIINALPRILGDRVSGYAVSIEVERPMEFKVFDNTGIVTYNTVATVKSYGGGCGASDLITFIDSSMDNFLLDYLKANPKKKE